MTAAVDFGSHRIRVARLDSDQIIASHFRSVYSVLPDSLDQRTLLARLGLPYAVCDSHLAVIGDHADELKCINSTPPVPIFADGQIAADDPPSRQILNVLIESMLPTATGNEACAIIAPGAFQDGSGSPEFLRQIVGLRGYTPLTLSPGLATVLAEGSADRFSAIGISFGASCCHVSLVARGNEIDHEVIARGGDWLNIELARQNDQYVYDRDGHCYFDVDSMGSWKEASYRCLTRKDSALELTLVSLYNDLLARIVSAASDLISRNAISPGPIAVLCSGGTACIDGFEQALRTAFTESSLTSDQIGDIRIFNDPLTVARGGLIQVALHNETKAAAA